MSNQDNSLKEVEIKLYASRQILEKIYKHSIFTCYSVPTWQQKELLNQYIDTPDHKLTQAGVALRIRKDDGSYIQTLKARGNSIGGFSERDEFDWFLEAPELDTTLLSSEFWPKTLERLDKSTLKTIFSTNFIRDCALFTWQKNNEQAQIEVAIDRGVVEGQEKQEPISELELELKAGNAAVMLDFAIELAKLFPLMPSNSSKAERGYRLIDPDSYDKKERALNVSFEGLHFCLAASQYFWESYCWQPDRAKLVSWIGCLRQLRTLLQNDGGDKNLVDLLDEILADWQQIMSINNDQLHDMVRQELNNTRWGLFLLSTSLWLLNSD